MLTSTLMLSAAMIAHAAPPDGAGTPGIRPLPYDSPLGGGSGWSGWGGFEWSGGDGTFAAVERGPNVWCYEAVEHAVFHASLTPAERAGLSAHL